MSTSKVNTTSDKTDLIPVDINLGGLRFTRLVRPEDKELHERAQSLLRDRLREVKNVKHPTGKPYSDEAYLYMVAYDLAMSMQKLRADLDETPLSTMAEKLIVDINDELNK